MIKYLALVVSITLMAGLSSCASFVKVTDQPVVVTSKDWYQALYEVEKASRWQIEGKIGVRQPERADTAQINEWLHDNGHSEIKLSSSFMGMGSTEISGSPGSIKIIDHEGNVFKSSSPKQLLLEKLGWTFPIEHLSSWIKGIPVNVPESERPTQVLFDGFSGEVRFSEYGWDIVASRYARVDNLNLPRKIKITNDLTKITFVISQWSFPENEPFHF